MLWILRSMGVSVCFVRKCLDNLVLTGYENSASDLSQPHRGYSSGISAAIGLSLG